ncbi:MAG TPA: MnhB domain-containing protein [Thermoanaerobaculaceae bacterium]|nr:MnhB domain-containing protein [Thermoanaerobaculaceae bacterium]HRS16622.1 MnhB domain-containing protein [Thermoanaerobaculaceae bacterium]
MIARAAVAAACAALFAGLSWVLLELPVPSGLTAPALASLPASGVQHPVTAALLNYRGYDTLLELAVLLLAVIGVWSLGRGELQDVDLSSRPLLLSLLRLTLPALVVAGGYLLWVGTFAPGGAFQGGALLAGALVLAQLAGRGRAVLGREAPVRIGLAAGVAVFALVAGGLALARGTLLGYPPGQAGTWILLIEATGFVSIGLTLGALLAGGRPRTVEDRDA